MDKQITVSRNWYYFLVVIVILDTITNFIRFFQT
jgi:hypothetical protein